MKAKEIIEKSKEATDEQLDLLSKENDELNKELDKITQNFADSQTENEKLKKLIEKKDMDYVRLEKRAIHFENMVYRLESRPVKTNEDEIKKSIDEDEDEDVTEEYDFSNVKDKIEKFRNL